MSKVVDAECVFLSTRFQTITREVQYQAAASSDGLFVHNCRRRHVLQSRSRAVEDDYPFPVLAPGLAAGDHFAEFRMHIRLKLWLGHR
jgi:hypothetical protein